MAKKKEAGTSSSKIGGILNGIAKGIGVTIDSAHKEKEYISTGVYLLDAALSAKLIGGGIATNRISVFAGESGSGKSFLAYSTCKKAQELGRHIIYIDTEYSIELADLHKYGVKSDPENFTLIRSNKVEDINILLTQFIAQMKDDMIKTGEKPPVMIVLDSLGQMASNKELADLEKGDIKQDMTKAKAFGSLFRSLTTVLGDLEIPMLVCNQTYKTMDLFPQDVLKGGNALFYSASVIGMMSKSKLKTGEEDDMDLGQSGITVLFKTVKNRLAKPKKIRFDISFVKGMNPYTGLDGFCRPEFFDQIGIAKGKYEVDKETGEMVLKPGGLRWYVRHLGKSVTTKQLFTSAIFTPEVLKAMEPIVNNYFKFNDLSELIEEDDDNDDTGTAEYNDADSMFE